LETLPEWKEWVNAVNALTGPAKNAFTGKENLHDHQASISKLADTYQQLKSAYNRKYGQRG